MGFERPSVHQLSLLQTHPPPAPTMACRWRPTMGRMGFGQPDHNGPAKILSLCGRRGRIGAARATFHWSPFHRWNPRTGQHCVAEHRQLVGENLFQQFNHAQHRRKNVEVNIDDLEMLDGWTMDWPEKKQETTHQVAHNIFLFLIIMIKPFLNTNYFLIPLKSTFSQPPIWSM